MVLFHDGIQIPHGFQPLRHEPLACTHQRRERNEHVLKHMWHFIAVDRTRKHLEELKHREQHLRKQAEEDERLACEFLERRRREEEERMTTKVTGALPEDWNSLTLPASG